MTKENVLGKFGSRQIYKNMDMVCGQLINAQTTPKLDINDVYDCWPK